MVILVIIMIIFGAGKLPEIGSAFGRSIKNFKTSMKEAQEEDEKVEEAKAQDANAPQQLEDTANMTDEERAALARQKAQEEGEAKDRAMKNAAQAFTDSLPRKGSYDFAQDQEDQKAKKA